ncbi:hypothetical protein ACFW04_011488 [Cataglyphis niger]
MISRKYYHAGLGDSLKKCIRKHYCRSNLPSQININVNIDGLHLTKSSGSQFWSILGSIVADFYTEPFIIGVYHDFEKSKCCNTFLKYFKDDCFEIFRTGIVEYGKKIIVNVFICDAPAKSRELEDIMHIFWMRKLYSRERLHRKSESDESFKLRKQEHHKITSNLEDVNIGMVTQFPLNYMHLILLGVIKKLLHHRIKTIIIIYWANNLFKKLSRDKYVHFLSLSIAIRILCSKEYCVQLLDYAHSLLLFFVENYGTSYGRQYISYNIHNLIYLYKFNAFKFENYMQKIKSRIRSSSRPLEQLVNQLSNTNNSIINGKKIIKSVQCKGFYISTRTADNCCLLLDGTTISLMKIYFKNKQIYIIGKKYLNIKSFFHIPCNSLNIGIKKINESQYELITVPLSDIKLKCVKLPLCDEEAVVLPLLHQQEICLWRVFILIQYLIENILNYLTSFPFLQIINKKFRYRNLSKRWK